MNLPFKTNPFFYLGCVPAVLLLGTLNFTRFSAHAVGPPVNAQGITFKLKPIESVD